MRADDAMVPGGDARYWTLETGTQSYEAMAGWLGTLDYLRAVAEMPRLALGLIARYESELCAYARAKFAERSDGGAPLRTCARSRASSGLHFQHRLARRATSWRTASNGRTSKRASATSTRRACFRRSRPNAGGRAVRLSFAHYNTSDDVDRCFDVIDAAVGRAGAETLRA